MPRKKACRTRGTFIGFWIDEPTSRALRLLQQETGATRQQIMEVCLLSALLHFTPKSLRKQCLTHNIPYLIGPGFVLNTSRGVEAQTVILQAITEWLEMGELKQNKAVEAVIESASHNSKNHSAPLPKVAGGKNGALRARTPTAVDMMAWWAKRRSEKR